MSGELHHCHLLCRSNYVLLALFGRNLYHGIISVEMVTGKKLGRAGTLILLTSDDTAR